MHCRLRLFFIGLFTFSCAQAAFVPDDRLVSDPTVHLPDPEFDNTIHKMTWQDLSGNLWVSSLDPVTGDIIPASGKGQLVDTGLANLYAVGNGPEFFYGVDRTLITYTKLVGLEMTLAVARRNTVGAWNPDILDNADNRSRPFGTPLGTTGNHKLVYIYQTPLNGPAISWRLTDSPASEQHLFSLGSIGGRWFENEDALLIQHPVDDVKQLFRVDGTTKAIEQISSGPDDAFNAVTWQAPEFNESLVSAAINFNSVGIFRKIAGVWTRTYTAALPSSFTSVSSPEPFTYKGRSFISVIAAQALRGVLPLPYLPLDAGEVWIMGIDPANPFFRRIDAGTTALRLEPEPIVLGDDAFIYFSEVDDVTNNSNVHIANTGLGDDDWDSDGIINRIDNCVEIFNDTQLDSDADNLGDVCDPDNDNDGLEDTNELVLGTDPFDSDSDDDGLSDYEETNLDGNPDDYQPGVDTNPLVADTDGDTLDDGIDLLPLEARIAGDIAPLGSPDGAVNAGDALIFLRILQGDITPGISEYANGDLFPSNGGDGIIDTRDFLLYFNH